MAGAVIDSEELNRHLSLLSVANGAAVPSRLGTRNEYLSLYTEQLSTVKEALSEGVRTAGEAAAVGRFSLEHAHALRPISIERLQPGHLHLGWYLLVRVAETPFKLKAVCSVVEGACGQALYMSVYHLSPTNHIMDDASRDMGKGAVMVIKVRHGWGRHARASSGSMPTGAALGGHRGAPSHPAVTALSWQLASRTRWLLHASTMLLACGSGGMMLHGVG